MTWKEAFLISFAATFGFLSAAVICLSVFEFFVR